MLIVQLKTYMPSINPVTLVVGEFTFVNTGVFGPLTLAQVPVPVTGVFPCMIVEVVPHMLRFEPAFEVVGLAQIVTIVVSEEVHGPLATVQLSLYTPGTIFVIVEVAELIFPKVGVFGPLMTVHVPRPTVGAVPVKVVPVVLQRT